jgi:hypothetical protein
MQAVFFDLYKPPATHFDPAWTPPPTTIVRRLGLDERTYTDSWKRFDPLAMLGQFGTATAGLFFSLAFSIPSLALGMILLGQFVWAFTRPVMNITLTSLMASITPDQLIGRMTASRRFIMWGVMPLGGYEGFASSLARWSLRPTCPESSWCLSRRTM